MNEEISNEAKYQRSMVSSVPTILRPRVRIPSTPFTLFSICIIEIVMKNNENKQKEAMIGPFKKNFNAPKRQTTL